MKIQELQQLYSKELTLLYSENEIQKLFTYFAEEYLQYNSIQLKMYADQEVEEARKLQFTQALEELKSGKPYQQILGKAYFYGEEFLLMKTFLFHVRKQRSLSKLF